MTARRRHPTQRDRVLRALEAAGPAGVASTDFLRPRDDGKPILRVASRIDELRRAGHAIDTRRAANGTARYVLRSSPAARSGNTAAAAGDNQLFDGVVGVAPSRSPYDPEAAA